MTLTPVRPRGDLQPAITITMHRRVLRVRQVAPSDPHTLNRNHRACVCVHVCIHMYKRTYGRIKISWRKERKSRRLILLWELLTDTYVSSPRDDAFSQVFFFAPLSHELVDLHVQIINASQPDNFTFNLTRQTHHVSNTLHFSAVANDFSNKATSPTRHFPKHSRDLFTSPSYPIQ